jgi:16S rRNA (cytidine1402-2'-O)-methyltransferase
VSPLSSNPGFKLVEAALAEGIAVTTAPGPSAVLAALAVAGLPTDRFFFDGFLPQKQAGRRARLGEIASVPGTLILFESSRRLAGLLADAAAVLGDRPAAVARELTKLFEEIRRGTLRELAAEYAREGPPKGEVVVLIGSTKKVTGASAQDGLDEKLGEALKSYSLKEAVALIAADRGLPRRQIYARALQLRQKD